MHLHTWRRSKSALSVSADYASEIQSAVGPEIYGPIFKAGIFLFLSGFISSFIVAYMITKYNLWDSLASEFQEGEQLEGIRTSTEVSNKQTNVEELKNLDI